MSTYALGTFFRLPLIEKPPIGTLIAYFITSGIDGVIMGSGVYWWGKRLGHWDGKQADKKKKVKYRLAPQSARKPEKEEHKKVRLRKPFKLK